MTWRLRSKRVFEKKDLKMVVRNLMLFFAYHHSLLVAIDHCFLTCDAEHLKCHTIKTIDHVVCLTHLRLVQNTFYYIQNDFCR